MFDMVGAHPSNLCLRVRTATRGISKRWIETVEMPIENTVITTDDIPVVEGGLIACIA